MTAHQVLQKEVLYREQRLDQEHRHTNMELILKRSLKVCLYRKYTKALTFQNVWQELAAHVSAYQAHIMKSSRPT
jgi:hypothetical protein